MPDHVGKLSAIIFFLFLSTVPVYAKDATSTARETLREKRETTREKAQEKREQVRENLKERRENLREKIQVKREEAKEKFKAKREAFTEKLAIIQDEKKKAIVERVDTKMANVNQHRTDSMSQALVKINEKLTILSQKIDAAKAASKDTTAAEKALSDAQAAYDAAQTAVSAQAGNEYVVQIGTETTLRTNVDTTVSQLQQDLRTTHQTVVAAKQAAQNVVRELAKLGSMQTIQQTSTTQTIPTQQATPAITEGEK